MRAQCGYAGLAVRPLSGMPRMYIYQAMTLGTCMEYAASSNATLLSPSIDFVKPLVSEYLTSDQSYINGVFDSHFVPAAASGTPQQQA